MDRITEEFGILSPGKHIFPGETPIEECEWLYGIAEEAIDAGPGNVHQCIIVLDDTYVMRFVMN